MRDAVVVERVGKRYNVHGFSHDTLRGALLRGRHAPARTHRWALRDVSLRVAPGEAVALVGHNGAGKSTLLRLIAGIERPTYGRVGTAGRVVGILGLGIGFSDHLSGEENVEVAAGLLGLRRRQARALLPDIAEFSGLPRDLQRPVREYSSGMVARLAFALAVHVPADVLLVDETLSVGDEEFRARCIARIERFRADGGTLLFASHEPALVDGLADRALTLRNGIVVGEAATREGAA